MLSTSPQLHKSCCADVLTCRLDSIDEATDDTSSLASAAIGSCTDREGPALYSGQSLQRISLSG